MIPQFDLKQEYSLLENKIQAEIRKVFSKTNFIQGENVKKFEEKVANYIGVKYAISCNSGTDALHFALRSLNIGKGDEVITTPFTFISTIEAIMYLGAKPVFADINKKTYNISKSEILKKITSNTKAIIPVHLFGNPFDVEDLKKDIDNNFINIIEDCAQSFGAGINHKRTGSLGDIGCFSFYPTKNLGCYGDGGIITTNSEAIYKHIKKLTNHGSSKRYHHDIIGFNSRLDEIQAAILNIKLKLIDETNMMRVNIANIYNENLSEVKNLTLPYKENNTHHVYHQYTISSLDRDIIKKALEKNNIGSAIYYPISLEKQSAYKYFFKDTSNYKNSNFISTTCLSLPMYPYLSENDVLSVCNTIKNI